MATESCFYGDCQETAHTHNQGKVRLSDASGSVFGYQVTGWGQGGEDDGVDKGRIIKPKWIYFCSSKHLFDYMREEGHFGETEKQEALANVKQNNRIVEGVFSKPQKKSKPKPSMNFDFIKQGDTIHD